MHIFLGPPILGFLLKLGGRLKESRWFAAIKTPAWFNPCHLAAADTVFSREAVKVVRVGWDENGNLEEYVDPKAVRAAETAALLVDDVPGSPVKPLNVGLIWTLTGASALVALLVLAGPPPVVFDQKTKIRLIPPRRCHNRRPVTKAEC